MNSPRKRLTRKAYLDLLDAFLMNLAGDSQMGVILGFEEKHGGILNRLLRDREALDGPERDPGRERRISDAIVDLDGSLARLREVIRG